MGIDPSVTTAGNDVANGGSAAAPSTANNNRGLRMLMGGNGPLINRCNRRRRRRQYSARYYALLEERRNSLQIWKHKEEFLNAFKQNQTVIVVAETGSGKSTQIPQFVLEALDDTQTRSEYMVACTQPQQVAALKVSRRVAEEMDVKIGEEVGYIVPFGQCISENTILNYSTDGMLLREAMTDPLMERYNVIILDEAHQRTPETDVLFGLLKQLLKKRPDDLKLVVMSGCALEAEKLQGYFSGAPRINVPERLHPVEIFYLPEQQQQSNTDYLEAVIQTLVQIHTVEPPGDILVFLPGYEEDIEDACRVITWEFGNLGDEVGPVKVVPLHSRLPPAMQQSVFEPAPAPLLEDGPAGRKIVVSTNIAETSLTIDGIVYVVDSGFSKQRIHPLSKASAHQRVRRAGWAQPGRCFRLYTEENFKNGLEPHAKPEILQSDLESTVLTLRKLGIYDLGHFDFMDPPSPSALKRALEVLKYLGALDDDGNMTKLGEILSEFPLDPQKAKMLVVSPEFNCSNEILSIAAMLSVPNCFVRPVEAQAAAAADGARARFAHVDGDHLMLLKVYHEYKQHEEDANWCNENFIDHRILRYADNVRKHLSGIMVRLGLKLCSTDINSPDYYVNIRKAMLAGYIAQVAYFSHHPGGYYVNVIDNEAFELHPSTSLDRRPEWIIYSDKLLTTGLYEFIRTITDVREEWLAEVPSRYYDLTMIGHYTARDALERLYTEPAEGEESKKSEARRVLEMLNKQREEGLEHSDGINYFGVIF